MARNAGPTGSGGIMGKSGLSMLIETGSTTILFDTGATGVFADNAAVLGLDLASVDVAVLSHHHFDHGGGLRRFLELNPTAPVMLREAPLEKRWFKALKVITREVNQEGYSVALACASQPQVAAPAAPICARALSTLQVQTLHRP